MRDPDGRISFEDGAIIRRLEKPAGPDHFLRSSLASLWVSNGDLIDYEWIDSSTVRSPRLPFITLPSEWTASQFYAAAELTLCLQTEAVAQGWDLKDASAWNIVFDGLRPVFVDLLSFEPLRNRLWHAAGQFSRHFLLPLLEGCQNHLEPRQCMQLWRDGIPPDVARRLIGPKRYLTRYWPLMAKGNTVHQNDISEKMNQGVNNETTKQPLLDLSKVQNFRASLHSSFMWMLKGVNPDLNKTRASNWENYENQRSHYSKSALNFKRNAINSWLTTLSPKWVLDIGCNAGEFAELAVDIGAHVICWDSDAKALDTLYWRHCFSKNANRLYPILGPVDDTSGGRGWMAEEFPSLFQRLERKIDVVMLLAITHHLAIACSIPLDVIFRFVARIRPRAVLIELVSDQDERVQQLCRHYRRDPSQFSIHKQYEAVEANGFRCVQRARLCSEDTREYAWLELSI